MTATGVEIVIPTLGRPSLARLLQALGSGTRPDRIHLVDDRRKPDRPLLPGPLPLIQPLLCLHRGGGHGPAAARNQGWRCARSRWVAFLDDDVIPQAGWMAALIDDLDSVGDDVAGTQGRLRVPAPRGRPATDWERNVSRLEEARWITADMAFRRAALESVAGFDESFGRAYREDTDLALRLLERGWRLARGSREVTHPVRPASPWVSVRLQRGNADDVILTARHGRGWRQKVGEGPGRRRRHLLVVALGATALAVRRRPIAMLAATGWVAGTTSFALERIRPGPRDAGEVAKMVATSIVIPPAATFHWLRGLVTVLRHARLSVSAASG
ncbi:MAG TPA: glycosyltransferase [Actinomycetota bacterium]|nr:glycosyltransferase [Actinomycetota bacterium]